MTAFRTFGASFRTGDRGCIVNLFIVAVFIVLVVIRIWRKVVAVVLVVLVSFAILGTCSRGVFIIAFLFRI